MGMSREEAREIIKSECYVFNPLNLDRSTRINTALDMAIKALEQDSILNKVRAEIEALIEWHDCPIEYDNGNDAWYCEACNQAIKIIDKYKTEMESE